MPDVLILDPAGHVVGSVSPQRQTIQFDRSASEHVVTKLWRPGQPSPEAWCCECAAGFELNTDALLTAAAQAPAWAPLPAVVAQLPARGDIADRLHMQPPVPRIRDDTAILAEADAGLGLFVQCPMCGAEPSEIVAEGPLGFPSAVGVTHRPGCLDYIRQ